MKLTYKVLLSGLFLFAAIFSYAQDSEKKMTKEEKKAEKARIKQEKVDKENADWLLFQDLAQKKKFVVELNKVTDNKTGKQYILSPRLNFVALNDNKVILQLESNSFLSTNGLGGTTIAGSIDDYQYAPPKNDKKPLVVSFNVIEKNYNRSTNVFITVSKGGNSVIQVGNSPNFYGTFKTRGESNIFVGADMNN